jgi:hypothetical protein
VPQPHGRSRRGRSSRTGNASWVLWQVSAKSHIRRDGGSYAGRLQSSGWSWKGFSGKIFILQNPWADPRRHCPGICGERKSDGTAQRDCASRDASGRRTPVRFASGRLRLATSPIPGDNGEAPLARPGHALAKHMRLAEGQWARQRDSRDRIEDCDLLLLSGLFRRRRLAKDRVDQSLRARQRDHSDAQSAALGTWQHASAGNLKNSFACRCYGCTGAGRLFAGKSSRGGFLSRTSLKA